MKSVIALENIIFKYTKYIYSKKVVNKKLIQTISKCEIFAENFKTIL